MSGIEVVKPTRIKSELEALILKKARTLDLASIIKSVAVRAMSREIASANWILVSMSPTDLDTMRAKPHSGRSCRPSESNST